LGATNDFGCNAIQWCAQTGDVATCRWLQRIGLDLGLTNNNGHSAVHKAAVKGQTEVCEWLLRPCSDDGANGGGGLGLLHLEQDGDGNDPAEMARLEGFAALAAWLRVETNARRAAAASEAASEVATSATDCAVVHDKAGKSNSAANEPRSTKDSSYAGQLLENASPYIADVFGALE
jgi:cytochrome c553